MHIYISNLHRKTTAADIKRLFNPFGPIALSKLTFVLDMNTRLPRGFAFVDIDDEEAGHKAIGQLHGTMLTGNKINVKLSG